MIRKSAESADARPVIGASADSTDFLLTGPASTASADFPITGVDFDSNEFNKIQLKNPGIGFEQIVIVRTSPSSILSPSS